MDLSYLYPRGVIISKEYHFGVKDGSVPPVQAERQKNGAE